MYEEIKIATVEEYLRAIKAHKQLSISQGNYEDFLFRGQRNDLPLIPKIARLKPRGDLFATERIMLEEFKRSNPLLIEVHRPMDDWDYLTLGQHFGLPTRFLDWSNNALTALWFVTATGFLDAEPLHDAVVWVLMAETKDFEE